MPRMSSPVKLVIMWFEFTADRPVLNFVPTVAERGTQDEELLVSPDDLVRWAAQAGLVDDVDDVTPRQLDQAKALREAAYGVVAAVIERRAPDRADRESLNAAAGRPGPRLRLDADGTVHREGGVSAMLAAIARDCLELCDDADGPLLRWCADANCTRPFVDRSRGVRRRWCGMKGCGDRAKAAAYRQRRRHERGERSASAQ